MTKAANLETPQLQRAKPGAQQMNHPETHCVHHALYNVLFAGGNGHPEDAPAGAPLKKGDLGRPAEPVLEINASS